MCLSCCTAYNFSTVISRICGLIVKAIEIRIKSFVKNVNYYLPLLFHVLPPLDRPYDRASVPS